MYSIVNKYVENYFYYIIKRKKIANKIGFQNSTL